jgi:hypothetical protein
MFSGPYRRCPKMLLIRNNSRPGLPAHCMIGGSAHSRKGARIGGIIGKGGRSGIARHQRPTAEHEETGEPFHGVQHLELLPSHR